MFIVSKNNFEENWKRALGERAHIREVKTEKGIFKMEMKNSQRRSKVSLWQISCINGPSIFLSFYVFWWCPPTPTLGLAIGLILVSETKTNLTQAETWISAVCFPILLPSSAKPAWGQDMQWNPTSSDVPVIIQHVGRPNQDHQRLLVYMQLTAGVWVRPQSPAQINRNSQPTSTFVNEKKCFLLYTDEVL